MEKGPRGNRIAQDFDVKNENIGTVGELLKLTQSLEIDPNRTIIFYWEDRRGMLHATSKDFMSVAEINKYMKKLSPYQELPNKFFLHVSHRE